MSTALKLQPPKKNPTETPIILHTRVVTGTGGGPEKTILKFAPVLEAQGLPGDLRTSCTRQRIQALKNSSGAGSAAGAEVVSIPDRGPFDLSLVKKFRSTLRTGKRHNLARS